MKGKTFVKLLDESVLFENKYQVDSIIVKKIFGYTNIELLFFKGNRFTTASG